MKPKSFMLVAGEASGDMLAAELVQALRREFAETPAVPTADYQPLHTGLEPRFFGAGGPRMAAAGVDLAVDMTAHSVIGLSAVIRHALKFRRLIQQLYRLALERQPDAIICVDFSGFNLRLAHAVKQYVRAHTGWFHAWQPKLIQYVSPQVWASREGRARKMARDVDLLLSTFAFEKEWYARRVPQLPVEFVGHPMVDRYGRVRSAKEAGRPGEAPPRIVLLPGSRPGELRRHVPVLVEAARRIAAGRKADFLMVLPHESLAQYAEAARHELPPLRVQIGGTGEALSQAALAITKSGTITLECAYFGVPAVVFYKTSALTYQAGKRMVKVKYLAMPNLLANEAVFPEFIQGAATGENLARAALELLDNPERRARVKAKLAAIAASLGPPGASRRAAQAICKALNSPASANPEISHAA